MKIIQINGWLGRLNGPLVRFIKNENPDIVCMQEAFAPDTESLNVFKDQYEYTGEIIRTAKFPYNFFKASWGFEMATNVIDVGNIIFSKFPLSDLSSFHTYQEYSLRTNPDTKPNTRTWQGCVVNLPDGKKLSVANYHGYVTGADPNGDNKSIETMQKARRGLESLPTPLIFCGDLNVGPDSPVLKVLDGLNLVNQTTVHKVESTLSSVHRAPLEARENVACDYIFTSRDIQVKNFRVSDEIVSDHKTLVLEFEL